MDIGLLLIEICMVGFCAILVYFAKRDLNTTAAMHHAATMNESRQLEEMIRGLIDVLEEKAQTIETRMQRRFDELDAMEKRSQGQGSSQVIPRAAPQLVMSRGYAQEQPVMAERPPLPVRNGFGDSWRSNAAPTAGEELSPIARALMLMDGGANAQTAARLVGMSSIEIETAMKARQLRRNRNTLEQQMQDNRVDS